MYQYLVQLKGNGAEDCQIMTTESLFTFIMTATNLFTLAHIKPERMEIFHVQFGQDPRRMRWGFDGITLWIYDKYGNTFDRFPAAKEGE